MRLRFSKSRVTCSILILYVLIPMLDRMACANCMDKEALRCNTTIGCLQAPHDEAAYASHDGTESKTPGEQDATPCCSICANFLMGVDVFVSHVHLPAVPWTGPSDLPTLSSVSYSIDKPPQNLPG